MTKAKTRYMVFSGFLGAGKTTTMAAVASYVNAHGGHAGLVVNDLGGKNLVDGEYMRAQNLDSRDVTGDCICYVHDDLVDKIHQLEASGADFVMSDIPGCGIGAYNHVYATMERLNPGEFHLMPFTCVCDPERLRMLLPEQADIHLPREMAALLHAQLKEADLILLNKIDTIDDETREADVAFLRREYPRAHVMAVSAKTGEGIAELAEYLMGSRTPMELVDIGYGSEEFIAYERVQCWYNNRSYLVRKDEQEIDFNRVFSDLFEEIRIRVRDAGANVAHLKLFAEGFKGDVAKLSLLGVDYATEVDSMLEQRYAAISFVVNARAVCDSEKLMDMVDEALDVVAEAHGLRRRTFFVECFGMSDEGRGNGGRASRAS